MAVAGANKRTFVLVHGAWHGGWCWRRVADALEASGHKVFAPTMTGLGERSHLLDAKVNLATHIADIVNVMKWEGVEDAVLCGHSYGGMVISGVTEAMRPKIASIVYLDAFFPQDGDSLAEKGSQRVRDAVREAREKNELAVPPAPAAAFKVNEKDQAWVDGLCTPHPVATFVDRIALTGAREKIARKTYIRALAYESPVFDAARGRVAADRSWRVEDLPCGHDVMVDMPERLTDILVDVA